MCCNMLIGMIEMLKNDSALYAVLAEKGVNEMPKMIRLREINNKMCMLIGF